MAVSNHPPSHLLLTRNAREPRLTAHQHPPPSRANTTEPRPPTHHLHYHVPLARWPRPPPTISTTTSGSRAGHVTCPPPSITILCKCEMAVSTHPPSPLPPPTRERATSPAHHHLHYHLPVHPPTISTTTSHLREGHITCPPPPGPAISRDWSHTNYHHGPSHTSP